MPCLKKIPASLTVGILFLSLLGCSTNKVAGLSITQQAFGRTADGESVDLYTLTNANGCEVKITNYGGILVALRVPDRKGKIDDVVLGYDTLEEYLKDHPYFGALIGRYGNRIAGGTFHLDGVTVTLATNNGPNHLHGGLKGFDKVVWQAEMVEGQDRVALSLSYLSKDGEEGYPGNLSVKVTYSLTRDNELEIDYWATTDQPTVVNLTHHSYFNLAGAGTGDILGHEIAIRGDRFLAIGAGLIPTGELRSVQGTPMDFTTPAIIGARIDGDDEQLRLGGGYDHTWVLNSPDRSPAWAARVYEPTTGRVMEVFTTEPGLQFYTGNFLDGTLRGKGGRTYEHRYGFCLETQHFPDSPNHDHFPSTVLEPGQTYRHTTIYKFSTR